MRVPVRYPQFSNPSTLPPQVPNLFSCLDSRLPYTLFIFNLGWQSPAFLSSLGEFHFKWHILVLLFLIYISGFLLFYFNFLFLLFHFFSTFSGTSVRPGSFASAIRLICDLVLKASQFQLRTKKVSVSVSYYTWNNVDTAKTTMQDKTLGTIPALPPPPPHYNVDW